jgi:signal transduction histidine kinase
MTDREIAAMGPLPRTHGLLGAMLETPEPYLTGDIHLHPRFRGWWPEGHPDMRSFLGVPIVTPDGVIGAFYLTQREGADGFDAADEELIELLAAHAAIAITNARLYERSRELTLLSERNRLALELHDAVSQKLFGLMLTAEAAAALFDRDLAAARAKVARLQTLAREALDELRALVLELRPPELARDGLCGALAKHVELQRRLHEVEIALEADAAATAGGDPARDHEVLRIAQEALHNALRHAAARHVSVRLADEDPGVVLEVHDDGVGFEPSDSELRGRHLGLTSMEERARRLGALLRIASSPGAGTTVRLEVARG